MRIKFRLEALGAERRDYVAILSYSDAGSICMRLLKP